MSPKRFARCALAALATAALAPGALSGVVQAAPCPEVQCTLPDGSCGWPGNGGCYADVREAECYQGDGCLFVAGVCWLRAGSGCYPPAEAACVMAGGVWVDDHCEVPGEPPSGDGCTVAPEPRALFLLLAGASVLGLISVRRRRRPAG